ncbi:heparinase [Opitutaceae bacterium TAV4]|nr:heparinase [Opitutaceae bacterium TAV4]RRK01703.1 heparinase [Opitutaceae bacterium TAV3]
MPLFLTDTERTALSAARAQNPARALYWALVNRAERRAASPSLATHETTTDWWHFVGEYITDAAMVHAIKPSPTLDAWLRSNTLAIARRPVADWVGPNFRNHTKNPPIGHLETAHLSWAIAVALDLAPGVFTEAERSELTTTLRETAIPLCQRWLDDSNHLANWRCVLNAGVATAAAVINDTAALARAADEFRRCVDIFQPDGSYGESLQYSNYAAYTLMLARESLTRRTPELDTTLPLAPYALKPRWDAASHFYTKPLSGWGAYPRPRAANFNDSAAIYRATADLLLHIATRAKTKHPAEARLARWLFDTHYTPVIEQPPHDQATFGFVNDFGFLSLSLLPAALETASLPPSAPEAGLDLATGFSCGDVLARDAWPEHGGRTILAIHGAPEPLHGPGHLHGDLNSFILVHNQERLLADPGHSCYRNLIHEVEARTNTHNTCTFTIAAPAAPGGLGLQEDQHLNRELDQTRTARRHFDHATGRTDAPVTRGGRPSGNERRTLLARAGRVTAIASEASALYGSPLTEFTRIWLLCGTHALFVIDRIRADEPVTTTWHWLLNNRDDALDLKLVRPDRLVARRGNAGMKLFHCAGGNMMPYPMYSYIHDAYHPLPNQLGEGKPGSGLLVRWTDKTATTDRLAVHAICVDDPGATAGWHLKTPAPDTTVLESPGATETWTLVHADATRLTLTEKTTGETHTLTRNPDGTWILS